jgi:hypothetical protein
MEVLRAVAVGFVFALARSGEAWAQGAGSSSTAAFPDTAPQRDASTSSRAGYPGPAAPPAQPPAQARTQAPAYQYQQYPAQSQWSWYSAQTPATPQSGYSVPAYQGAWGANTYVPPPDQKRDAKEKPTRYVSLTLSPVHLALPVFEATLEVRPTDHLGIAAVGGLGDAPPVVVGQTLVDSDDRFSVREFGAQVLVYPLSKFDGFVVGAELLSVKVSGTATVNTRTLDVTGSALAFGPLLGGKWIHESGFTLFGHLGVQRLWLKADTVASGQTITASDSRWFPLINLNAGWSF